MTQYQRETVHLRSDFLLFGFDRIKLVAKELVHLKHVNRTLLEYGLKLIVAEDLSLVARILELVRLDVLPELLDNLWAGELLSC